MKKVSGVEVYKEGGWILTEKTMARGPEFAIFSDEEWENMGEDAQGLVVGNLEDLKTLSGLLADRLLSSR